MINGLIGKKMNMTTSFDGEKGIAFPATVIKLGPCKVTQVKTLQIDGYESVQLGFDDKKEKNTPKAMLGHFAKAKTTFSSTVSG